MSRNDESKCILDEVTDRISLCYANKILACKKKKDLEKVFIEKKGHIILKSQIMAKEGEKHISHKKNQNCRRQKEAEGNNPILTYTGPCKCERQYIKKWLHTFCWTEQCPELLQMF